MKGFVLSLLLLGVLKHAACLPNLVQGLVGGGQSYGDRQDYKSPLGGIDLDNLGALEALKNHRNPYEYVGSTERPYNPYEYVGSTERPYNPDLTSDLFSTYHHLNKVTQSHLPLQDLYSGEVIEVPTSLLKKIPVSQVYEALPEKALYETTKNLPLPSGFQQKLPSGQVIKCIVSGEY